MPEPALPFMTVYPRGTTEYQSRCSNCRCSSICLPLALEGHEVDQLDQIVQRGRPMQKGEHLYRQDESFRSVYALRSGSLKAYTTAENGQEQVIGFYYPGEIIGMDGIARNRHASSARALETIAVCEIPFDRLCTLSRRLPRLQRQIFQLMSQEITADQQLLTLLGNHTAEQRVATLLLNLSARNKRRRLSPHHLRLSMSRADMANYLGLSVETVSRVIRRLHRQDVLSIDKKDVSLLAPDALQRLAQGEPGALLHNPRGTARAAMTR